MRRLRDRYCEDARVIALSDAYVAGREANCGACHGGLASVLIAALITRLRSQSLPPPVIIANDPVTLRDDLDELGVVCAHLPTLDRFADEGEGGDRSGLNRRMAALEAFSAGATLIADPRAVEQPIPDIAEVTRQSIVLRPGSVHDLHRLIERMVEVGYRVVPVVEGRGEIAVRGGLVDVYPWIGQDPLRIEFFGDHVDSIRRFDAFSQESIAQVEEAVLATASGGLATRDLWSQLPTAPLIVLGDFSLRSRLQRDHGRAEIRFARQLDPGAIDGASMGIERLRGDVRRGFSELSRILSESIGTDANASTALLLARNSESEKELAAHAHDAGLTVEVRTGRLSAGFRDQEAGFIVVHDFELMERAPTRRRANRVAGGQPLAALTDLKRNDLIVHLHHGIGIFRGMATLEKRGFLEDFLLLEFAEGTKLYVPVDAIDLIQKYIGATGKNPDLSKIGGTSWAKKRAKAEKAIQDMSGELLKSQALRLAAGGVVCTPDAAEQRQFEARFPFEETEDQLAAVREIKADMEKPVAMDRLLCGDVGFGKTEVAMRAACKAVFSGHQVAVLVPTTLLAEQHLESFTERFTGTSVRIAGMNRFRTSEEKRAALAGAIAGTVDIVIGTHALLTDKLSFKSLGLLIIDEEHRFGVKQKERLRALRGALAEATDLTTDTTPQQLRTGLPPDVLTLSATPIPRTLHFSLLGLRDISVLAEAPAERLAVETHVSIWDDETITQALLREKERQGQIFVVTNRVQELDKLAYKLSKLVPGLITDCLHGQMDEDRISRVMDAFRHKRLDCLISTSIIESGIDIPNANTLLVHNAHCFGLAELHQIRGRIGRFTHQAHAYFITPHGREVGEEARERLNAIQEYAELGAGFKLAMRDLELRGAGNLLGAEQSGQIDAIGYELYTKLLGEAVARAKNTAEAALEVGTHTGKASASHPASSASRSASPTLRSMSARSSCDSILGLPVDAYIPDDWLETPALKFEIHKSIDNCRRLSDLESIARNVRDRFGALVDPVIRLFQVRALRLRASEYGLSRIDVNNRQIRIHVQGTLPQSLVAAQLPELVHLQLDGSVLVLFLRSQPDQDAALNILCRLLGLDLGFLGRGF